MRINVNCALKDKFRVEINRGEGFIREFRELMLTWMPRNRHTLVERRYSQNKQILLNAIS